MYFISYFKFWHRWRRRRRHCIDSASFFSSGLMGMMAPTLMPMPTIFSPWIYGHGSADADAEADANANSEKKNISFYISALVAAAAAALLATPMPMPILR